MQKLQCISRSCPFKSLSPSQCRGRKKAALTYVATYSLGCFTKHFNNFKVLLVGRIFCGVSTSLLFSAFESWLVAEHFKVSRRRCIALAYLGWYVGGLAIVGICCATWISWCTYGITFGGLDACPSS